MGGYGPLTQNQVFEGRLNQQANDIYDTQLEELLAAILNGSYATGSADVGPDIGGLAQPDNTFEDLFQEQLRAGLGPDPNATFRNVFGDIYSGYADTPLEQFILSQFDELQNAYITASRAAAEQGRPGTTFEAFLKFVRPNLEKKFGFTQEGAADTFNQILKLAGGGVETPYVQFVASRFGDLYNQFTKEADNAERSGGQLDFATFMKGQTNELKRQYQYTQPGALENFQATKALRESSGIAESPFERYIEDNFNEIYNQFRLQGGESSNPATTFGSYLGQNQDKFKREFAMVSPRSRGQQGLEGLVGLTRQQA